MENIICHPQIPFRQMNRREFLIAGTSVALPPRAGDRRLGSLDEDAEDWVAYQARFIDGDGRVVDTGNGGISHSAGQGVGLLFATHFADAAVFDRILGWTNRVLGCREDSLFAWRFIPTETALSSGIVPDHNNATDGDLFIACALSRASRRWGRNDYRRQATDISKDIRDRLILRHGRRLLLLPGVSGFDAGPEVTINPSYYLFFALAEVEGLAPSPLWAQLWTDGLDILSTGRFGRWMLPPDWLVVGQGRGALKPAPDKPPRFSYDAVLVPLYLAWARLSPPGTMEAIATFWKSAAGDTAWIDLRTGDSAGYGPSSGMQAIRQLTETAVDGKVPRSRMPRVSDARDYYSATLIMLTRLAWRERALSQPLELAPI